MIARQDIFTTMEICLGDAPLHGIAIFGPRRSGTNYLQQISLLNTLNCYSIHMDASDRSRKCRLLINGYAEYGSKHSMRDRPITTKIRPENLNLIIIKSNIRSWLYSRLAYQLVFSKPDFKFHHDVIDKWIRREILEFLGDLNKASSGSFYVLEYESLTVEKVRTLLSQHDLLITRFPVDHAYATSPGGGTSDKIFKPRKSGGNEVIESYLDNHPEVKGVNRIIDLLEWAQSSLGNDLHNLEGSCIQYA